MLQNDCIRLAIIPSLPHNQSMLQNDCIRLHADMSRPGAICKAHSAITDLHVTR